MTTARTHQRSVGRGGAARPRPAVAKPDNYVPVDADSFDAPELAAPESPETLDFDPVDADSFDAPELAAPESPETLDFDPADHSIDDVKAFIDENPGQVDNVLELELEGKNRSTLIEWLDAHGDDES